MLIIISLLVVELYFLPKDADLKHYGVHNISPKLSTISQAH